MKKTNKKMPKKPIRKSNFELLRILAMIMIIVHHITIHCFKIQLEDKSLCALSECFNKTLFSKRLLLPQLFMPIGKIGNIIFILITGYFLINKRINIVTQIKKNLSQLLFIVPILVLVSFSYYKYYSNTFIGIQNFNLLNTEYWFIGYYIGIITIAYIFLNKFLNKLEKKHYIELLVIMFSILSIAFLRNSISNISGNLTTLFVGVFIYSLGGFIRLYNPFKNIRSIILLFIIIIAVAAICLNYYNETLAQINIAIKNNTQGMHQQFTEYSEYNIFCLLIGVCLFEIFKRIKMENDKVINYISSATFMMYLVHDNTFFRNIWREKNWVEACFNNYIKFVLLYLEWIILIFIIGIILYTIYYWLLKMTNTKFFKKIIFNSSYEN